MAATWLRFRTERGSAGGGLWHSCCCSGSSAASSWPPPPVLAERPAPDRLVAAVGGEGGANIFDVGTADPDRIRALPLVDDSAAVTFFLADSVPLSNVDVVVTDDPQFHSLVADGGLPDPADPLGLWSTSAPLASSALVSATRSTSCSSRTSSSRPWIKHQANPDGDGAGA